MHSTSILTLRHVGVLWVIKQPWNSGDGFTYIWHGGLAKKNECEEPGRDPRIKELITQTVDFYYSLLG